MNKLKLFLENFFIYGLGGVINKIVPLLMIPIVTRLMPDSSYFGISDMSNTLISIGTAVGVMGMYDAMYRMFFESYDEKYRKSISSTAFLFTLFSAFFIFFLLILNRKNISSIFFGGEEYTYLVYIAALTILASIANSIVSAPTRMQNKRKIFIIMNSVVPLLSYSISIPLLINGYYLIALPVGYMISSILNLIVFYLINYRWFDVSKFDKKYFKEMLKIAIPLLPNFLIYWIFNSSDKIMITNLLGTSLTGIYSVGSKLGNASQIIYSAFAGGWQYFSFSTMKEKNQVNTNSKVFEYLGVISFIISMFVFALSKSIYSFLFTGEYVYGHIVSPYLFLAPLLQMLFQVAANQFIIIKKTWPNVFILSVGAVLNIVLNMILIPVIGIEGAAIATLVGYTVSNIIVIIVLTKMKLMALEKRFFVVSLFFVLYIIIWRMLTINYTYLSLLSALLFSCFFVYLYKKDIGLLLGHLKTFKRKKVGQNYEN